MSQNIIKIRTRKDDYKRIYQQDEIKYYLPRTKKSCQLFDWIVSLFAFGSAPKYYVEFTPCDNDIDFRIALIDNVTCCPLSACPPYIIKRYLREGYDLDSAFYCIELAG